MASKISSRDVLTLDDIYQRYYSKTRLEKCSVAEIWREISSILDVPEGQLRPGDKLLGDLTSQHIVTPKLDNLSDAALARSATDSRPVDLSTIETVDDYVKAFAV